MVDFHQGSALPDWHQMTGLMDLTLALSVLVRTIASFLTPSSPWNELYSMIYSAYQKTSATEIDIEALVQLSHVEEQWISCNKHFEIADIWQVGISRKAHA